MRIALIALLLLTGCAESALKRDIAATLKDPGSAKFGKFDIHGEGDERTVCGTVNAKNAFGAYTGETPFMVKGNLLYLPVKGYCCGLTIVEERESTAQWRRECEAERPEPIPLG